MSKILNSEELGAVSFKNSLKSTRSRREESSTSQRLVKSLTNHNVHFENDHDENNNNNTLSETNKSIQLNLSYHQENVVEHTSEVMVNTNTIQKLGSYLFEISWFMKKAHD